MNKIRKITKKDYSNVFNGAGMVMNIWSNKHSHYVTIAKDDFEANKELELSLYKDTKSIAKDMRKAILVYGK